MNQQLQSSVAPDQSRVLADIGDILALADSKKISIPGDGALQKVARVQAVLADGLIKKTVTGHSLYIDEEGCKATSKKGFVLQINKRIKVAYGAARSEMSAFQLKHVSLLLEEIATIITEGEAHKTTRGDIKAQVYMLIEHSGHDYKWRKSMRGDAA